MTLLALIAGSGCESARETEVQDVLVVSPAGDVRMEVTNDAEGRMTYTVRRNGETVVESSPVGLLSSTHDLSAGVTMFSASGLAIDETYTMPSGKRRERQVSG
ncbi:MAG: glycoside hydrolase family 97 N-terminal domain-containing protein, partial [Polyangiales bacterium]